MSAYLGFRVFVGPAFTRADDATYYDASGIVAGSNPAVLVTQTTLATTLANGATTCTVTAAANLPAKGGVFIGPNGSGQGWEYVPYTGRDGAQLSGLVREAAAQREHSGVHSAGAVVRPFIEFVGNDGKLRVSHMSDDAMVSSRWTAEISGIGAPQVALRPFHLAVIQVRTAPNAPWQVHLVGYLDRSSIRDDYRRAGEWTARIVSLADVLGKIQVQGVRVGDFDAAAHATAQSSAPLASPHKERHSGDYRAAAPSFAPDNVLSDEDTIWIADEYVGTPEPVSLSYQGFTQIYINPPATLNQGHKWIEWINRNIAASNLWIYRTSTDETFSVDLTDIDLEDGERAALVADPAKYAEMNPQSEARILDVRESNDPYFLDHFDPAGGAVGWAYQDNLSDVVMWGNQTTKPPGWDSSDWSGPPLPAPKPDETMRYLPNATPTGQSRDVWAVGRVQSPGYQIKDDGDDAWLYIELPGMQLALADDITASEPGAGDVIRVVDASGGPSTDGLPAAGTLVIGDEQITYTAKTAARDGVVVAQRGANGTAAAAHSAGDAIFIRHVWGGRTMITDALPIDRTVWVRRGGGIYPAKFTLRWSALVAASPAETRHEGDYEEIRVVSGHIGSTYEWDHQAGFRARSFVFEFERMNVDPARPRMNRVKMLVDKTDFDATRWLASGQTVGQLISRIAQNAGIAANRISVGAGTLATEGFATAIDNAWAVMVSAAEMGGAYVEATADGRVSILPDGYWTNVLESIPISYAWTRANAAEVELVKNAGGTVSQVRLHWQTPDGATVGEVRYPTTPDPIGRIVDLGPYYYADEGAAELSARKRYWMTRYPFEWMIVPAEGDLDILPRRAHSVTWQLDPSEQPVERVILVRQVDHIVQNNVLETVIFGTQVDREDAV